MHLSMLVTIRFQLTFLFLSNMQHKIYSDEKNIDPQGYIAFCPCMGRFGNQADHYLGVLGFAKALNRTLILPPWVEYRPGVVKSIQVPFDTYFKIEPLQKFTKVISMENFMKTMAPTLWPPDQRIAFCYMPRHNSKGCNAKEGNPFGPFWDTFNIDFVGSETYSPLNYDVYHHDMGRKWNEKYTPNKWPVLAFTGAPASFPVQMENRKIHKYLQWSEEIEFKATNELSRLPRGPVVAIHLRNGIDWVRACEHVDQSPSLFAAPQCLGYRGEYGTATKELCLPSKNTIVKQLKRVIKNIAAKSVFVASDNDHMIHFLSESLSKMQITVHRLERSDLHVELAIMGRANHFIGNCISSFSAFAKRERDVNGFPSSFWAFPLQKSKIKHTEL